MIIHGEFQQKNGGDATQEWNQIRLGKITASECKRFVQLDGKLRKGDMPRTYLCEKLFERWTGRSKPGGFLSIAVNNGIIVEDKSRAFASLEYGLEIKTVGFVSNNSETCGLSPDGLIGFRDISDSVPTNFSNTPDGASGFESKSPELATHIDWLLSGELPQEHLCQVQASMFFTDCQSWHFLSYPLACYLDGFPPFHLVVERDGEWQRNFAESVEVFKARYDAEFSKLCDLNGGPPPEFKMPATKPEQPQHEFDNLP